LISSLFAIEDVEISNFIRDMKCAFQAALTSKVLKNAPLPQKRALQNGFASHRFRFP
jgi:hypothetical protein